MTATLLVGDVFQRMAQLPDHSYDLIITSPPFLALRSYLPDDHPQKHLELGSEATPAEFLDTMLALTAEWRRLLAPHGSIAVEIGDTYAGSGGAGGDYGPDGLRAGQPRFRQNNLYGGGSSDGSFHGGAKKVGGNIPMNAGPGWPLAKSLCGIPQLYATSLMYGRNLLTGQPSPAGMWRIRNLKPWIRTNPPVGALGDKERPATSYVTVATLSSARWFDLDAVRTGTQDPRPRNPSRYGPDRRPDGWGDRNDGEQNPGGAPPLDWWHQTDATIDRVIQDPSSAVEALFAATAPKHITACPTCGGSGTHQITPIVGESSVTGETARNRPTDSTEPERQGSPTPGDHHPADAVIDRVIQERAGQGDRGGKNRVANSSASRGISGGDDGNPDKPRSPGASTIGARGHHIRKALTDAGILPPHPDTLDINPKGYAATTPTSRLVPCGPHDGGQRITSRGCPVHGDRPAPPRKAPDDAHAGSQGNRTPRTDDCHAQEQLDGFFTTAPPSEPTTAEPSSDSLPQQCAPSATPHDTESSRTDPAPTTNPPGTPSAETTDRTARTSTSPSSDAPNLDTPPSRTGEDGQLSPESGTPGRTADMSDPLAACTCSYHKVVKDTESTSHYAVWPPELVKQLVDEMCPRRVCTTCGEPSRRIVGPVTYEPSATHRGGSLVADSERVSQRVNQWKGKDGAQASVVRNAPTVGWSECEHDNEPRLGWDPDAEAFPKDGETRWRPGRILDPFSGSGTTLAVATGMGRDAVGIDLDPRNAALTEQRCGMFLTIDWGNQQPTTELPPDEIVQAVEDVDDHTYTRRDTPDHVKHNDGRPPRGTKRPTTNAPGQDTLL